MSIRQLSNSEFGVRNSEFPSARPAVCVSHGEGERIPNSEFRIQNFGGVSLRRPPFQAREVGDGRVALFELLQGFQGVSSVIVLVEVKLVDHDLVVPGLPVTGVDGDGLVKELDGPFKFAEIAVDHREVGEDIGVAGRDLERFLIPIASIRPTAGVEVDIAHGSHQTGVVGVGGQQPLELGYLLAKALDVGARGAVDGRMSVGQLFTLLGSGLEG